MSDNQLIARSETLCRAVAREDLGEYTLYIVLQSTLPTDLGGASVCDGYTSPSLDLHLRDFISDYRGRGPCIVVNDTVLHEQVDAEDFELIFLTVVIHELAHVLERPSLYRPRPGIAAATLAVEAKEIAQAVSSPAPPEEAARPYAGHEQRFIRICLHLAYRMSRLGFELSPPYLCAGWQYGLSHMNRYQAALGDEPARMDGQPIWLIRKSTPPLPFINLWLADVARWENPPLSRKESA